MPAPSAPGQYYQPQQQDYQPQVGQYPQQHYSPQPQQQAYQPQVGAPGVGHYSSPQQQQPYGQPLPPPTAAAYGAYQQQVAYIPAQPVMVSYLPPVTLPYSIDYINNFPLSAGFNATNDVEVLYRAMKGLGTDEKTLIKILGNRNLSERMAIKQAYPARHGGKSLEKALDSETSGNFCATLLTLLQEPLELDVRELYWSCKGAGTNEDTLVEILCTRSNLQKQKIIQRFHQVHCKSLESMIASDTSGDLNAGEGRLGTDEHVFIDIFTKSSYAHLRELTKVYERNHKKHTLEKAIKSEFSGNLRSGLLAILSYVNDPIGFWAETLYNSMKETTPISLGFDAIQDSDALNLALHPLKGSKTDHTTLIRILGNRNFTERMMIKEAYARRYGKTLAKEVYWKTSFNYKITLKSLISDPEKLDAKALYVAMMGKNNNLHLVIEILCTRNNQEKQRIAQRFREKYHQHLETFIRMKSMGNLHRLLRSLLMSQRDESTTFDPRQVEIDTDILYQAGEGRRHGTDDKTFIEIFTLSSYPHLREVTRVYELRYGHSLETVIKSEFSLSVKRGMLTIYLFAKCGPQNAQAEPMRIAFTNKHINHINHSILSLHSVGIKSDKWDNM
eukprot:gene7554-8836_t